MAVSKGPRVKNEKGKAPLERIPLSVTWKAMEQLVNEGLVRSIGVSNFPVIILNDLLSYAVIPPVTNEVEIHPFHQRTSLIDYCHDNNIHNIAYYPAAHFGFSLPNCPQPFPSITTNPILISLAKKYNKTTSQISLRWGIQRKVKVNGKLTNDTYHVSVIPRSSNPVHIKENIDILNFSLTDEEMDVIAQLEEGYTIARQEELHGFPMYS